VQEVSPARGLQRFSEEKAPFISCYAVADCKGLFGSITTPAIGSLLDVSMMVYLVAARECLQYGPLSAVCWVPTRDMLVDSCTKDMEDKLWNTYYRTGMWIPSEAIICERVSGGENVVRRLTTDGIHHFLLDIVLELGHEDSVYDDVYNDFYHNVGAY
jgi:hypothetical protein